MTDQTDRIVARAAVLVPVLLDATRGMTGSDVTHLGFGADVATMHAWIAALHHVMSGIRFGDARLRNTLPIPDAAGLATRLRSIDAAYAGFAKGTTGPYRTTPEHVLQGVGKYAIRRPGLLDVKGRRHHVVMQMSTETADLHYGPIPTILERRHLDRFEDAIRQALIGMDVPSASTVRISTGLLDGYMPYHSRKPIDGIPLPDLPVEEAPSGPLSSRSIVAGVEAPIPLLRTERGQQPEAVSLHCSSISMHQVVHEATTSMIQIAERLAHDVKTIHQRRSGFRSEAAEIAAFIGREIDKAGPATTLKSYSMRQEVGRLSTRLTLTGYDPDTYRPRDYPIADGYGSFEDAIKKIGTDIADRIEKDRRLHKRLGRLPEEETPDLSKHRIDRPLALMLSRLTPDRTAMRQAVEAILARRDYPEVLGARIRALHPGVGIDVDRGHLRLALPLAPGVEWRGGRIWIKGMRFPEQVRNSLVGGPLDALVKHDLLQPGMTITSVQPRETSDGWNTTAFVGNATIRADEAVRMHGDPKKGLSDEED